MRRVGIEIVGNAVSGIRAMVKTGEAASAMGKEITAAGVKAEKSAEMQINAAVKSRRAIEENIAAATRLGAAYSAGSREQIAAMNYAARERTRLGRNLASTDAEAAALAGGAVGGRRGRGALRAAERTARGGGLRSALSMATLGLAGDGPAGAAAAAAIIAGAVVGEGVKMSAKFHAQMLLIRTQAGASSKEVDKMSGAVLRLSASVGQSPEALAKGLYHIESYGYRGAKALNLLKLSAQGAAVGHDELESTTNALLVMSKRGSHIKGVGNAKHAMGLLDAIVGAGNMRMPDLTAAFGTGVLGAAANFGVTMPDLGAAIATLTHAGQDPSEASTRLRMTFSLLAAGSDKAEKTLEKLGLTHGKLAKTMRTQGLGAVFKELHDHLQALPIDERSAALTRMFGGGRSSAGAMTMLQQLGNFDRTAKQIHDNAKRFGPSFEATSQTLSFRLRQGMAGGRAGFTALGDMLEPSIKRGVNASIAYVKAHWPQIRATFHATANDIRAVWAALWPTISRVARIAIHAIEPTIRNIARIVRGVVELVKGIVHGDWRNIWKGAKDVVAGTFHGILVLVKASLGILRAVVVGVFRGIWSSVKNLTSTFFTWLETKAISVALKVVEPFSHIPRWLGGGWAQDMKKSLQGQLDGIHAVERRHARSRDAMDREGNARDATSGLGEPINRGGAHKGRAPHGDGTGVVIRPINLDTGGDGKGSLIPRALRNAVLRAGLTKGRADDIASLRAEETYLRQKLAHAVKGSKLYDRLLAQEVAVHKQLEAAQKTSATVAKKLHAFTVPMSLQLAQARADALAAGIAGQQGPTSLQIAIAKRLKATALKSIRSHKLSMQGLIDAWSTIGGVNQTLASQMKGLTGTYHAVSKTALTEGLNLSRDARVLLEQRLAQRSAHRGYAPNAPAALGQGITVNGGVHLHGIKDVDQLAHELEKRGRTKTQRGGTRR